MCLAAIAIDLDKRFPLVIAANRDEFFDRPTARLGWWRHRPDGPQILGGRDLKDGGTWLGLSAAGRLGLLTNVRDPARVRDDAPSRGELIPQWLAGDLAPDKFWVRAALGGYNDFNLLMADFRDGECWWVSNVATTPRRLERGVWGLSNAALDTPWPKVEGLKQSLRGIVTSAESLSALTRELFTALSDRSRPQDEDLPQTGIPLELERELSPAFIRTADGRYGTRCSTLIVTERQQRKLVTHVIERSYTHGAALALLRTATLANWPPRYTEGLAPIPVYAEGEVDSNGDPAVIESECAFDDSATRPAASAPARYIRPRARSLLKPTRAIR